MNHDVIDDDHRMMDIYQDIQWWNWKKLGLVQKSGGLTGDMFLPYFYIQVNFVRQLWMRFTDYSENKKQFYKEVVQTHVYPIRARTTLLIILLLLSGGGLKVTFFFFNI